MLIDMSKSCQYRCFSVKTRISEKLSDHLVFCRNILTDRHLTIYQLSANCLDDLLMKGIVRCKEFRRHELHALAESWKMEYGCYNINLLGIRLTAILPIRGKHIAHDGQAPCPSWASSVPNFNPNRSLVISVH